MRLILLLTLVFSSVITKAQLFGVIPINKFEKGYYYDLNDQKITGKIAKEASLRNSFTNKTYILLKTDTGTVRVSPDMMKSFVIGLDSFTVSHGENAAFYRVMIDSTPKIYSSAGLGGGFPIPSAGGMGSTPVMKITSYFYGPDADHLSKLDRKNFKEIMIQAVGDEPTAVGLINDGTFAYGDLKQLIEFYNRGKERKKLVSKS